ncbi:GNAT family N-acetyltransferase [Bradyrhizobium sp. NP1]|jgi:ribosomal protein S18 acetylase RimI-like enzyme|uniref:GNAT family N-acetyltransferase n=1 Tax=Bradyrhizobium sp. NP1 TaxID=3049772 RepID=UPI0025A5BBC6|nr:GNAT family N-acetyltransferase [Bradyrhizobium sp. NP1]WJR77485.1 GNAT family N-acetyltransferase [Bradyrhizobium sp. NP1]
MVDSKAHADIRLLAAADAAPYREIRLEALRQHPEAFSSTFARENEKPLAWFEERIAQGAVFGAFAANRLVGVAGFWQKDGEKERHKAALWGMYVRPAARRSGVGRRLVEAVLAHAAKLVEQLQLAVVSGNDDALRLYRNAGFVEYGREMRALRQDGRYLDEILMARFLKEPS